MSGTSVLPPHNSSEADHVLDMPLHHKPNTTTTTATTATTTTTPETMGGLHMIKERDEDDTTTTTVEPESIRQQYENMTYDDLSQRMAENYKQLSAMLGKTPSSFSNPESPSSSLSSSSSSTGDVHGDDNHDETTITTGAELDNENDIIQHTELDEKTKKQKMTQLFCRAASTGDLTKVTHLLKEYRTYIDIDARDEDGTTPLIYAACFGKVDIAQALLEAGAKTDVQDSYGWSALMWATNNNQEAVVKVLLESGASSNTRSAKGRTVFDFLNTDNQKIVEILATNPRDSFSSTSSIMGRNAGSLSSSSSNAGDYDFYYQSTLEGYDNFMTEEADRRRKLLETAMALAGNTSDDDNNDDNDDGNEYNNNNFGNDNDEDNNDDDDDDDDDDDMAQEFHWDKCLPDQMFVFGAENLQYILDTVITNIQLPVRSHQEICVPANVIFLSARFAHYFSSDELVQEVLEGAMNRISDEIKSNARNVHVLAFWITNATQLLYYLKKDTGLVVATAEHQLHISELISEIYTMIINDTERRLTKILVPAMLDHEQIPGMEDVNFADDWQRFFRRSTRRSVVVPPDGAMAVQMKRNPSTSTVNSNSNGACSMLAISPQSVTSLLTSTLYVLQSYDVHPTIIIQALAQFFHFISCEMFNRILSNKKLLCRSKALQIRMNMSHIEDWIGQSNLPHSLVTYFDPTTQLLQLLQCLTQLQDLVGFIQTVKKFDSLNALQVKRCVTNYRYEVNESRLPDEIEKYAMQLAEDTVRYKQARNQRKKSIKSNNAASGMSRTQSVSLRRTRSRRESVSSFVGSIMSSVGISASASMPPTLPSSPTATTSSSTPTARTTTITEEESLKSSNTDNVTAPVASEDEQQQERDQEQEQEQTISEEPLKLDDEEDKEMKETRDPKFMLPFSVPTTAHMVSFTGWAPEEESKRDRERLVTPVIPSEWMDRLDNGTME
ncbi:hypothetical protein BDC45DRAFT_569438 [Circinella umbellata]|nr:hypothetical protein BDC45DRAFT_569438 [Circinella umbellata]